MVHFPTNILIADDGSAESELAIEAGAEIALATNSALSLVHVKSLAPTVVGTTVTSAGMERLRADGQALLDRRVDMLTRRGVPVHRTLLRLGRRIENTVLAATAEVGAGLLVVGVRGANPSVRFVLGDISMSLVRDAPCTVLAVRSHHGNAADELRRDASSLEG